MKKFNADVGDRVKQNGRRGTVKHVYRNTVIAGMDVLLISWDTGRENLRSAREVTLSLTTKKGIRAMQEQLRERRHPSAAASTARRAS